MGLAAASCISGCVKHRDLSIAKQQGLELLLLLRLAGAAYRPGEGWSYTWAGLWDAGDGWGVGILLLVWGFSGGSHCKAEVDSAGRRGRAEVPELQGLVGLVPSVALPAEHLCYLDVFYRC